MRVEELTPSEWELLEANASITTVFHDVRWLTLVQECLGGNMTLYACDGSSGRWLVPCYSGPVWTSMGFRIGGIGYGGPLPLSISCGEDTLITGCLRAAHSVAEHRLETCVGASTFPHAAWAKMLSSCYPECTLNWTSIMFLEGSLEHIFENILTGNKRTAIRKATRLGVEARSLTPADAETAHMLVNDTQRRVGASYRTPLVLLRRLLADELPGIEAHAAIYRNQIVSVAITLTRARDGFLLFHGWDAECDATNANEFVYWQAIKGAAQRGVKQFDLGRSHSPNLLASKLRWGSIQVPVLQLNAIEPSGQITHPRSF